MSLIVLDTSYVGYKQRLNAKMVLLWYSEIWSDWSLTGLNSIKLQMNIISAYNRNFNTLALFALTVDKVQKCFSNDIQKQSDWTSSKPRPFKL